MENAVIVIVLIAVALIAVKEALKHFRGEGGCCGGGDYKIKPRKLKHAEMEKTFLVGGMHCEKCAMRVMEKVQDIPGTSCRVDLKKGTAHVQCEQELDEARIRAAIEKAGYEVTGVL